VLSEHQFRGLSRQLHQEGGFTAIPTGPKAGQAPSNRFMVGTAAEEHVSPGIASHREIADYASQRKGILTQRGRHLGGWAPMEGDQPTTYLDTPHGFPTNPRGEAAARRKTVEEGQLAYGRLGAGGEYEGDVTSPVHPDTSTTTFKARQWINEPLTEAKRKLAGR
jgi:hypothetical protein